MRKFIASSVVVLFAFTLATAEDIGGRVTKIDGNTITYVKGGGGAKGGKGKGKKAAEPTTIEAASNITFSQGTRTFDKDTKKADYKEEKKLNRAEFEKAVTEAGEKGVNVRLITADDGDNKGKVVEIRIVPAFGGKKKDAQ